MKKILIPAFFLTSILVGCATPNDLRIKPADLDLLSKKSAKEVAMCITEKWETSPLGMAPISMRETNNGYSVFMLCQSNTCLLSDIYSLPQNESKTLVYTNGIGISGYLKDARSCQ